ncbi:hypothetical protein [Neobittarella massiliensis]|uniref:DinB-like domain-containing protein n=1 Tax=uncultured Anaerotruncus sp. TaxID=905011 RepID=A0A1C6JZR4_9FIRM|nr:hypothetical protein [Neobittarella massiliensis]SCJ87493.1 Uncharacterised protein [uncultured Anaerotruncus sp.]
MNEAQKRVKALMDHKIAELEDGLAKLHAEPRQPGEMGDLYNGMLKQAVSFEITHMKHLSDELQQML